MATRWIQLGRAMDAFTGWLNGTYFSEGVATLDGVSDRDFAGILKYMETCYQAREVVVEYGEREVRGDREGPEGETNLLGGVPEDGGSPEGPADDGRRGDDPAAGPKGDSDDGGNRPERPAGKVKK